jgi:lipid-binding SYLF domain-containing protein
MKRITLSIVSVSLVAAMLIVLLMAPATASEAVKQQALVDKARITVDSFVADPEMAWLRVHLKDVKGVLIVPELIKGGFIVGGSGGSGVLLARDAETGEWTGPAFYSMGAASLGLLIGGQKSELVLLVMTRRALESLYSSSVKLGGDFSVAVGPVGAGVAAQSVRADMVSLARAKGAYGGISVDGAVVKVSDAGNSAYYGKSVRPVDILVTRTVSNPQSSDLRAALSRAEEKGAADAAAKGMAQFVYAKTTINIRSGPGTNYSVIRKANRGDRLEYISLEGDWYKLKVARGDPQAWVHKGVVTATP